MNPKLFFPDPDPTLTLISNLDSDLDLNPDPACDEKYIRNSDHLNIATKPDGLEKFI